MVATQSLGKKNNLPVTAIMFIILIAAVIAGALTLESQTPSQSLLLATTVTARMPGELVPLEESAWQHAMNGHADTVPCVLALARQVEPDEIWYSTGTPKEPYPSLAYVWNAGSKKNLSLAACAGLPEAIASEFVNVKGATNPSLFKVVMIVGQKGNSLFGVSIYPVLAQPPAVWGYWLDQHGYTRCFKCPAGR